MAMVYGFLAGRLSLPLSKDYTVLSKFVLVSRFRLAVSARQKFHEATEQEMVPNNFVSAEKKLTGNQSQQCTLHVSLNQWQN